MTITRRSPFTPMAPLFGNTPHKPENPYAPPKTVSSLSKQGTSEPLEKFAYDTLQIGLLTVGTGSIFGIVMEQLIAAGYLAPQPDRLPVQAFSTILGGAAWFAATVGRGLSAVIPHLFENPSPAASDKPVEKPEIAKPTGNNPFS